MTTTKLAETAALIRTEVRESLERGYEPDPGPWCQEWLRTVIRHVTRDMDIDCPDHDRDGEPCPRPGRWSGLAMHRWTPEATMAVADLLEVVATEHRPVYAAPDKEPYTCTSCPGSWPCATHEAAQAVVRAVTGEQS